MNRLTPLLLALLAALASGLGTGARAETWPARPVHMIVPAPGGSSLDVVARALADRLAERWKQPLVIDNKPGAGGLLGMDALSKARPDGYTLGLGFNGPIAFGPAMYRKMPYDPARDLLPVVLTTSQPNVLAVQAGNPANSVSEFVAWARKQGKTLNYASVGNGSSSHLTMELFKHETGFEAVHVPYAGSPQAGTALAGGEVQALFAVAPALLPLVQGGRIKLIGATSLQRSEGMRNVATVAESGYAGFESLAWNGLFVPAGTAPDRVQRINADVNAVLAEPAVRQLLARQGLVVGGGTPAEFKRFIDSEARKWGEIIRRVGITAD